MGLLAALMNVGYRVNSVEMVVPNGRTAVMPIPHEPKFPSFSLVIPRKILDAMVLEHALSKGAKLIGNVHAQQIEHHDQGVTISGERDGRSEQFHAKIAIIATGAIQKLLVKLRGIFKQPAAHDGSRAHLFRKR